MKQLIEAEKIGSFRDVLWLFQDRVYLLFIKTSVNNRNMNEKQWSDAWTTSIYSSLPSIIEKSCWHRLLMLLNRYSRILIRKNKMKSVLVEQHVHQWLSFRFENNEVLSRCVNVTTRARSRAKVMNEYSSSWLFNNGLSFCSDKLIIIKCLRWGKLLLILSKNWKSHVSQSLTTNKRTLRKVASILW